MEKKIKFSIFYNYESLGDVLILSKDLSAEFHHYIQRHNVFALVDKNDNIYGYNIFDINKYMKIYYKGLLSYPFDGIVDVINSILKKQQFETIPYYNFSGIRVGKIVSINEKEITISFIEEEVVIFNNNLNLNKDDVILYGYHGVLLPSLRRIDVKQGEILKEKDLFIDGNDVYIKLDDDTLIGKDFYKGEIKK